MNKPLLLILWILTLSPLGYALSPSNNSPPTSAVESATASMPSETETTDWATVLPVDPVTARIIGEEIETSLKASWNDGYKAARVEYEPQVDYWMAIAQTPSLDRFWDGFLWGVVPATVGGLALGVSLTLALLQVVR